MILWYYISGTLYFSYAVRQQIPVSSIKWKKVKAFGAKDQGMQEYLADHERFADLINGTVFAGKQIIEAQYLKEVQR